jgi:hypothetical protein
MLNWRFLPRAVVIGDHLVSAGAHSENCGEAARFCCGICRRAAATLSNTGASRNLILLIFFGPTVLCFPEPPLIMLGPKVLSDERNTYVGTALEEQRA